MAVKKSASRANLTRKPKVEDSDEEDFGELEAFEEEMNALRADADKWRQIAGDCEARCKETNEQLVAKQTQVEDMEQKMAVMDNKLRRALAAAGNKFKLPEMCDMGVQTDAETEARPMRSMSKRDLRRQMSRQVSRHPWLMPRAARAARAGFTPTFLSSNCSSQDSRGSNLSSTSPAENCHEEEDDDEEDEEINEEINERKQMLRELGLLMSRVRSTKDKEEKTRNERFALRQQLQRFRNELREERKR